jgi:hypothetical protein
MMSDEKFKEELLIVLKLALYYIQRDSSVGHSTHGLCQYISHACSQRDLPYGPRESIKNYFREQEPSLFKHTKFYFKEGMFSRQQSYGGRGAIYYWWPSHSYKVRIKFLEHLIKKLQPTK